jgi:hypothetical protein
MKNIEFSKHALDMIKERDIQEHWISDTIENPDFLEYISDNEIHYIKQINENSNRYSKVVVNPYSQPARIITVFFDRRIKNGPKS